MIKEEDMVFELILIDEDDNYLTQEIVVKSNYGTFEDGLLVEDDKKISFSAEDARWDNPCINVDDPDYYNYSSSFETVTIGLTIDQAKELIKVLSNIVLFHE